MKGCTESAKMDGEGWGCKSGFAAKNSDPEN